MYTIIAVRQSRVFQRYIDADVYREYVGVLYVKDSGERFSNTMEPLTLDNYIRGEGGGGGD